MAITFELKHESDAFRFDALDGDGNLMLTSARFASKDLAEQAIQAVRVGSMMSQFVAVGTEESGKYFTISNGAGQVLVKSVSHESELAFNYALHAFREGACVAEVNDTTAAKN